MYQRMKTKILLAFMMVLLVLSGCTAVSRSLHYSEPTIYSYPCTEHDSCSVYTISFHNRF